MLHLLDKIYQGLNTPIPEYTLGIFLDLKKAFETVDIEILLKKLNQYGFKDKSYTWFKHYPTNRKQYCNNVSRTC